MLASRQFRLSPLPLAGLLLGHVLLPALSDALSLTQRNPFIHSSFSPPESNRPAPTGPQATATEFAFQGVYQLEDATHVLVRDRREGKGYWLKLGVESNGITAKSFDLEQNRLLLASTSGEQWLDLAETPTVSVAVATAARRPANPAAATRTTTPRTPTPVTTARTATGSTRPQTTATSPTRTIRPVTPASGSSSPARRVIGPTRVATDPSIPAPRYVPQAPGNLTPPTENAPRFQPDNPPPP